MRIKTYFLVALWLLFQIANPSPIISGKYHITSLPGINNDEVQQYSGYLNVNDDSRIFFWLVLQSEPKSISENLMIWLNGGPGWYEVFLIIVKNKLVLAMTFKLKKRISLVHATPA
ncbi:hypothetical protein HMI55_001300 [Coelomomyces lativittatus]|nr:hypothetical protein HMI55_001300 [Coelomomyces lativittatus]KAJ1507423.1 hypothetical protein HMI56_000102 [Coelomomyces lativittatus]